MERAVFLDGVILQGVAVLKLLSGEDQPLLIRRNALLVLNLCFDIFNPVRGLYLESDVFAGQRLYENLHGKRRGRKNSEQGGDDQCEAQAVQ